MQADSSQSRVARLVLLAIFLAGVIVVATVAGWWPLSGGEEEEVLWGYVEAAKPVMLA